MHLPNMFTILPVYSRCLVRVASKLQLSPRSDPNSVSWASLLPKLLWTPGWYVYFPYFNYLNMSFKFYFLFSFH